MACVLLSLVGCHHQAVGEHHTPDRQLEETFARNEADFELLRTEVIGDKQFFMLRPFEGYYATRHFTDEDYPSELEQLGFPRTRWSKYRQLLGKLGIAQINRADDGVVFTVDDFSLSNGDSTKCYQYSLELPAGSRKTSLDGYRLSKEDKLQGPGYQIYKPLRGNWYLYLFVDSSP
jgi:hypothetical protein